MAEAKKREAESKKKVEARAANDKSTRTPASAAAVSGTASALQMLQSAYDDKKSVPTPNPLNITIIDHSYTRL